MTIIQRCPQCCTLTTVDYDPEQEPRWECWCPCGKLGLGDTAEAAVEQWQAECVPMQGELF